MQEGSVASKGGRLKNDPVVGSPYWPLQRCKDHFEGGRIRRLRIESKVHTRSLRKVLRCVLVDIHCKRRSMHRFGYAAELRIEMKNHHITPVLWGCNCSSELLQRKVHDGIGVALNRIGAFLRAHDYRTPKRVGPQFRA